MQDFMNKNDEIRIINLPKIEDDRGNLSFIEEKTTVPLKYTESYWIYDVPGGECRGSHAFKEAEEFIVALSGSFDIILNDGKEEKKVSLNRSYYGLYIPKLTWRKIENFSTNSLALVLSSADYNETDYIRDFNQFLTLSETMIESTIYNCCVIELNKIHNGPGILPLFKISNIFHLK